MILEFIHQIPNHIRGECPVQEIDRKFVPPPLGWGLGPLSQPTKENRQLEDMAPVVKRSPAKRGKRLLFVFYCVVVWKPYFSVLVFNSLVRVGATSNAVSLFYFVGGNQTRSPKK